MTLLLFCLMCQTQTPPAYGTRSPDQLKQGGDVLQRSALALGIPRLHKAQTLCVKLSVQNEYRMRLRIEKTLLFQLWDLCGVRVHKTRRTSVWGFDGSAAWQRVPKNDLFPERKKSVQEWREQVLMFYPTFLVHDLPAAMLDGCTFPEMDCLAIYPDKKAESLPILFLFVDRESAIPRAMVVSPSEKVHLQAITWLEDYQEVDGFWFPFTWFVEGRLPRLIKVDRVEIDPTRDESLFSPWPDDHLLEAL